MAKELYSAKVEGETKENLNRLTEKYKEQGLIFENGDLLNLAADLLERNLSVQSPRHIVGIEELDQLTSRINRLFTGMIEQNYTSIEALRIELEEKYEKAKLTIDSLIEEKQELKVGLTESDLKIKELTRLTEDNQNHLDKLLGEIEDKNKYIRLLESQNEAKDLEIKQLGQFKEQNTELVLDLQNKTEEIQNLSNQIIDLEDAAEKQNHKHQNEIRDLEFQQKEAVFDKEKELNALYNKELSEIRQQQATLLDKHEERLAKYQEQYNTVLAEKQRIETLYETLKIDHDKQKGNKPEGNM